MADGSPDLSADSPEDLVEFSTWARSDPEIAKAAHVELVNSQSKDRATGIFEADRSRLEALIDYPVAL